jgi:hypothetical protein
MERVGLTMRILPGRANIADDTTHRPTRRPGSTSGLGRSSTSTEV